MTALSIHEPSALISILREQVRTLGVTMRRPLWYVAAYVVVTNLVVVFALLIIRPHDPTVVTVWRSSQNSFSTFIFLGALFPFFVWNGETPSRRIYHVLMPVAREQHALLKTTAGWVWLMLVTALAVLLSVMVTIFVFQYTGVALHATDFIMIGVPFVTASIAYFLVSAFTIATESPRVWVGGIIASYVILSMALSTVNVVFNTGMGSRDIPVWINISETVRNTLHTIVRGNFGVMSALEGRNFLGSSTLWAQATALWLGIALLLTVVAAYRRSE